MGGFGGHGKRDAFAAVSFDDGNTWKTTNLSDSAVEFSTAIPSYPGDVISTALAVAGNHIAVAWASRYCSSGAPAYTADTDSTYIRDLADVATDLGIDPAHDLYLTDLFGVAGSQGLVDYSAQGYPTVGEVPFACLWSARGVLKLGDDPRTVGTAETSYVVWYKPERLTSGVRDVARVEIAFVGGAGVALVWQEDQLPDGSIAGEPRLSYARLELTDRVLELVATEAAGPVIVFEDGEAVQRSAAPILGARLSSVFGRRNHPVLGGVRMHTGIDYAAPVGTEVSATGAGRVIFAGSIRGYGITIDIDHGGGVVTRYAHLSEIAEDVRVGTRVKAGDEIGAVGATGLVSGPNLHYEVRVDGRPVDPKDQDALPEQEIATAADLDALATWRSETGFMPTTDGERG